jgi:cytochrome c biogenesis protein CcmG, thiol:disulfide interchange protein DsbE
MRHHRLRWAAPAALALLISLASIASAPAATLDDLLFDLQFVPLDGQPAPAFTLSTLDGKDVSLAQLKGNVVLLYFWTSW